MNLTIKLIGLFYLCEGVANMVYWNYDTHPWYFQTGRVLRSVLGIVLIVVG
jgi:uncharacterized membrane protein HdeD (DUF308 family)